MAMPDKFSQPFSATSDTTMGLNFPNPVNLIPYDAVLDSEYLNAALTELTDRTLRLADYLSTATSGKLLRGEQQICDVNVKKNDVVYWSIADQRFAPAISAVYDNAGVIEIANTGLALGICETKHSANVGDVVLAGVMSLTMAEAAVMLSGETVVTGTVYLSGTTPGRITRVKPSVPVSIGFLVVTTVSCDATCLLFLGSLTNLEPSRVVEYVLTALPAGAHIPPAFNDPHVIVSPDVNAFGWLPANHAVFAGSAPTGAKFGYNIGKEPTLGALWPPTGRKLKLEFVSGGDIGVSGFKRVQESFYQITNTTLWWMRDCYSQVPWNYELNNTTATPTAEPCDVSSPDQLILTFERSGLEASEKFVTKLNPSANSVIRFVNPQGVEASRGELRPVLNAGLAVTSATALGSLTLKTAGPGFEFTAGRVIEGLRSISDSIVVTGSHSRAVNPAIAVSIGNPLIAQGIVSIGLSLDSIGQDLGTSQVRLGDSQQKLYKGVSYIGLPSTHPSEVTCRFDIPFGSTKTMTLTPYAILFGRGAGPYQAVTASMQKIGAPPLPENGNTIQGQVQPLTFDVVTPSAAADADTVLRVNASAINVFAGETIFVTFRRALSTYAHDVGLIRIGAILRTL